MQNLFNFNPQIPGYEDTGSEPSLGELIYKYYRQHFNQDKSKKLTEAYIEQFLKQYKEI